MSRPHSPALPACLLKLLVHVFVFMPLHMPSCMVWWWGLRCPQALRDICLRDYGSQFNQGRKELLCRMPVWYLSCAASPLSLIAMVLLDHMPLTTLLYTGIFLLKPTEPSSLQFSLCHLGS